MVTAVTSMGRSGLYDWLMQRISAVVLLAYFVFVGLVLLGGVDYASWKGLYSQTWMRIFSLMALLSLGAHAWVGIWGVLTDYLTCSYTQEYSHLLHGTLLPLLLTSFFVSPIFI